MASQQTKVVLCLRLEAWPEADQNAWANANMPGDPFDNPGAGAHLRPASLMKARRGYGRWLCFLSTRGWLDIDQSPLTRVTRERLKAYFQELQEVGNTYHTIVGRFCELACALKLLTPGADTSWIRSPGGISIRALLPKRSRPKCAPDSALLFKLSVKMMDDADLRDPKQWVDYRDGLLLAILAARARRLRAVASLRLGHELIKVGQGYRIELTPDSVKTKKHDAFSMPEELVPYIDRYLDRVRPALLAGRSSDAFWISTWHGRLTQKSIGERVATRTKKWFGRGFGPHRFRHAYITTASLRASAYPGLGAAALGITGEVAEKHYNLARQIEATRKFQDVLKAARKAKHESPWQRRMSHD